MSVFMRVVIWSIALVLGTGAAAASAEDLQFDSGTILRYFERDIGNATDRQVYGGYEYLKVDYDKGEPGQVSAHLYGWLRASLGEDFFDRDATGELLYGYLEYLSPGSRMTVRAGRQYLFAGVTNEALDGVRADLELAPGLSLSAYAGQPAALETTEGRSGDWLLGGRLDWRPRPALGLGLSYKYLANDGSREESLLGIDLSARLLGDMTLLGFSTRNLVTDHWAEHSWELRIPVGRFELRPLYQQFNCQDFYGEGASSANPFRFYATLEGETRIAGGELFWFPAEQFEIGLRGKHYDYDQRFGSARYLSGIFTWKWRIFNHIGLEVGRVDGDEERNRYSLGRGFIYLNLPPGFVTADLVHVDYDRRIYAESRSFFASLGLGRSFLERALDVKFSIDYSADPYFDYDWRAILAADYRFTL